jgi:DME family drug/metabolite transporter
MSPLVPLLALASAFLSAGATIFIRQGLRGSDSFTGFWINLVVGTIGLWAVVILTGGLGPVTTRGIVFFVLAGLVGTVGGRLLRFVAIDKVGAPTAAALINLHPLFATVVAIAVLGEHVTAPILAGTVVIVVGTVLLSIGGQRIGFRGWQLILPLGSAACFGVVAVLRKLGLAEIGPVLGSAMNVTTALVAFTAFVLAAGHRGLPPSSGASLGHFVAAGVTENAAVFLNVVALGMGTVSVVAPLYGTAPIFVLVLSYFFLSGVETLSGRIIAGTVLIVFGVTLITALSGRP